MHYATRGAPELGPAATQGGDCAEPNADYVGVVGSQTIAEGKDSVTVQVLVCSDLVLNEPREYFSLALIEPAPSNAGVADNQGSAAIVDNGLVSGSVVPSLLP